MLLEQSHLWIEMSEYGALVRAAFLRVADFEQFQGTSAKLGTAEDRDSELNMSRVLVMAPIIQKGL